MGSNPRARDQMTSYVCTLARHAWARVLAGAGIQGLLVEVLVPEVLASPGTSCSACHGGPLFALRFLHALAVFMVTGAASCGGVEAQPLLHDVSPHSWEPPPRSPPHLPVSEAATLARCQFCTPRSVPPHSMALTDDSGRREPSWLMGLWV